MTSRFGRNGEVKKNKQNKTKIMKTAQQQQARNLYFQADMQPPDIAKILNISERTCYRWMKEQRWQQMKLAAQCMPAGIVDNLQWQIVNLQQQIMARPAGSQFATSEEANIIAKLVLCISRMKAQVTKANSVQILQNYIGMVQGIDPELAQRNMPIANLYLKGKAVDGFFPYDFEYDAEKLNDTNSDGLDLLAEETDEHGKDNDTDCRLLTFSEQPENAPEHAPVEASKDMVNTPATDNKISVSNKKPLTQPIPLKPGTKLPNGLIWLGNDWVFDPGLGCKREIKIGEFNALIQNGYRLGNAG
jgi:hypothetical protein